MRAASSAVLALVGCVIGGEPAGDATGEAGTTGTTMATTDGGGTTGGTSSGGTSSGGVDGSSSGGPPEGPTCPRARTEIDLPDDSPDPQIRALYVIAQDGADDRLDVGGALCNSVLAWTQWLYEETEGRHLRLDTQDGALDIGFVRLALTDAQMHGSSAALDIDTGYAFVRDRIERELSQAGLLAPGKIYAVYYGGTSEYACGGGAWPPALDGQVAAMYLGGEIRGYPPCDDAPWGQPDLVPRYIDYAMLHEVMHTLGHVTGDAPNEHSDGHVFDLARAEPQRDLLYTPRPDTGDPPWGVYEGGLVLDLGRDDYFEHGDPLRPDLSRSVFLEPMPPRAEFPPDW
jgi:hypothetical protein